MTFTPRDEHLREHTLASVTEIGGVVDAAGGTASFCVESEPGRISTLTLPHLVRLAEYVTQRPIVRDRMLGTFWSTNRSVPEVMGVVQQLPMQLLAEHRRTGRPIEALYSEFEAGLLAKTVEVEFIAPFYSTEILCDGSVDLAPGLCVRRLRSEELTQYGALLDENPYGAAYLASLLDHAIVWRTTMENVGPWDRASTALRAGPTPSGVAAALTSLRVAAGPRFGCGPVMVVPHGWRDAYPDHGPFLHDSAANRPPEHDRPATYPRFRVGAKHLELAAQILPNLSTARSAVNIALGRLNASSLRQSKEDRVIDACVALEAVLSNDRTELSHRVSFRAATVLVRQGYDPTNVYNWVKRIYTLRSSLAHGGTAGKSATTVLEDGTAIATHVLAERLLSAVLSDLLTSATPWTPTDLDAAALNALRTLT